MKKSILILYIIGIIFFVSSAEAKMETKSLTIGGTQEETENTIQTVLTTEVIPPAPEEQIVPVEVNNYIDVIQPYNYYPYPVTNYYTRTIGPYGVYTNTGGFGFNYQGHSFSYGGGFNTPIYVAPPPYPPSWGRPPHSHGPKPPPSGNRPPNGPGRPPHK